MSKEDERALMWLVGLYVLSKYSWQVAPALQQGGARLYDFVHNDEGHVKDLPGNQMTRAAILELAKKVGFADPKLATAIALAESGGVPGAMLRTSREYSVGLWQINTLVHPQYTVDDMKDPHKNALAALSISHGGTNWKPWTAYTAGHYRKFQTGILA